MPKWAGFLTKDPESKDHWYLLDTTLHPYKTIPKGLPMLPLLGVVLRANGERECGFLKYYNVEDSMLDLYDVDLAEPSKQVKVLEVTELQFLSAVVVESNSEAAMAAGELAAAYLPNAIPGVHDALGNGTPPPAVDYSLCVSTNRNLLPEENPAP